MEKPWKKDHAKNFSIIVFMRQQQPLPKPSIKSKSVAATCHKQSNEHGETRAFLYC
jgi:hypothetical protein